LEVAGALRAADKLSEAEAQLGTLEGQGLASSAEFLFQKGRLKERQGSQEEACALYEQALDREPQHAEAAFRLAYFLDLRGQNARAIELYRRVTAQSPSFVTALVNLGLLLEDHDDVDGAIQCFKEALRSDPTNRRAALHLRDAIKSLDMFYDETERKESERLESVLRLPVADFELSVRSRNCLAKMNVKTLGDLVRRTEHELLAFKNFGETSLSEIRNLLSARGLRLGMFREEEAKRARAVRMRLPGPESTALNKSISDLELSIRARRCMQKLNVESLSELVEKSEAELLAIKNFGQTSLNEIKAKLGELGLSLRPGE
jgi:DNA-directed RNA polymerase subunit alpha